MSQRLDSSPTEEIVAQVNDLGLKRAAKKFRTSPSTLSRWLNAQHYKAKWLYVREEPPLSDQTLVEQIVRDQLEKFGLAEGVTIEIGEDLS